MNAWGQGSCVCVGAGLSEAPRTPDSAHFSDTCEGPALCGPTTQRGTGTFLLEVALSQPGALSTLLSKPLRGPQGAAGSAWGSAGAPPRAGAWGAGEGPGRIDPAENNLFKGPEAGMCLLYLRNNKEPAQLEWSEGVGKRREAPPFHR